MAFVKAVESATKETTNSDSNASKETESKSPTGAQPTASAPVSDDESKKKFKEIFVSPKTATTDPPNKPCYDFS